MIANKTAAFNEILIRLGSARISSWESADNTAVVLRSLSDQATKEVLREYPWICATSRAILAQSAGDNLTPYLYMYQLPNDCLSVQSLLETEGFSELEDAFIIEGRKLYCNQESVAIKYTKTIEITEMDTHVAEAAILRIASKSAFSIVQDLRTEGNMYAQYQEALKNAKYTDGIERVNSTRSYEAWSE